MPVRLDKLVAERFGLSRRAAQDAVLLGRVDLTGVRCYEPGRLVEPDAALTFDPNRPRARRVVGRAAVCVLYEDDHILIVDKPAGLATLPSAAREPDTLRGRVERYLAIRYGRQPEIGIIHRLDTGTSGALAFARSAEALAAFQALFRSHTIERQYLAVVEGVPNRSEFTIDLPLVINTGTVRRRVARVPGEGRPAITHARLLERFGRVASMLACRLETGRTHQIRLHLAALGHPVVGDPRYRPRLQPRTKASFHRQALHAQTLGFAHPFTGESIHVEAPLPSDLAVLLSELRNRFGIPGAGG